MTWQARFRQWLGPGSMALLILCALVLALITLLVWRSPTGTISSEVVTWTGRSAATAPAPSATASPGARATSTPAAAPATPATVNITTTSKRDMFQQSLPSDAVIGALLGISALLLLTGVFLPRMLPAAFALRGDADAPEPDLGSTGAHIANAVSARAQTRFLQGRRPRTAEELSALAAQSAAVATLALQAARRMVIDPGAGVPGNGKLGPDEVALIRSTGELPQHLVERVVDDAITAVEAAPAPVNAAGSVGGHQTA